MKTLENSNFSIADLFLKHPAISESPQKIEAFFDKQVETRVPKLKKVMELRKLSESDIRQEFLVAIMEAMPNFDPARSTWRTYISRVCNNRYCNFRREYRLACKCLGNITAIDLLDKDDTDVIPTYEVDFETQGDVNTVMSKLPLRLQQIAELLKTNSPAQVASHLKTSRSTISRAMKKIRQYFLVSGFERLHGDATN
ncbi:MAG: sigma-70 family RNA polymerase sigma factor [Phycisphaerales bacterium]